MNSFFLQVSFTVIYLPLTDIPLRTSSSASLSLDSAYRLYLSRLSSLSASEICKFKFTINSQHRVDKSLPTEKLILWPFYESKLMRTTNDHLKNLTTLIELFQNKLKSRFI